MTKSALPLSLPVLAGLLLAPLHAYDVPGFTPDQVVAYKQTVDSKGSPVTLTLDVFTPDGHQATDQRPAIVFFFGGGWNSGSPSQFHPHCEYLASRGMVAISADYRVANTHGTTPQECVKDGKSAVHWIRENAATLGIDPNRIAAGGGSAGGHVAAATGTLALYDEPTENLAVSSKPDALVLFNPVYDNGPGGYGHSRVQAYWEHFSPLHNIDAATPPATVFLGTNDSLIPVATAENFQSLMQAQGIRSDLHLYQDQPHGFFNYENPGGTEYDGYLATVFRMDAFLVSLGWLGEAHGIPAQVRDWVTIFGDATFTGSSNTTASPTTTDADADAIAANITPVTLADGDFIRLTGTVTINATLSNGNFRIGLFDGDDPVTTGDGTGFAGIWSEAPATSATKIAAGDGTGNSHPFESNTAVDLGPVPAANTAVPSNTPVEFSLWIARNGSTLDIATTFTDGAAYHQEQNLLDQSVTAFDYNSVALLMTGNLNATQATFADLAVTTGPVLPAAPPVTNPNDPTNRVITYVDAVAGPGGNTFATGGSLADTSWNGTSGNTWENRSGVDGNNDSIFEPNNTAPPEITTQLTGLADGTYDIWVFYWDQVVSDNNNWVISASLDPDPLTSFSSPGEPAVSGTTKEGVYNASDLQFTSTVDLVSSNTLRNLFGVHLGQATVSGGAPVSIRVANLVNNLSGTDNRTWFDGVGYALVPETIPQIATFTALSPGLWELTLQAQPAASYQFRSSPTLDFTPGTLIENLTLAGPGTVGGSNNSTVTTDANGTVMVRIPLPPAPTHFLRASKLVP